MATEPPQIGHDGWDLVHCDWELRQRDAAASDTQSWWSRLLGALGLTTDRLGKPARGARRARRSANRTGATSRS